MANPCMAVCRSPDATECSGKIWLSGGSSRRIAVFRGCVRDKSVNFAALPTGAQASLFQQGPEGLGCRRRLKPGGYQHPCIRRELGGNGAGGAC